MIETILMFTAVFIGGLSLSVAFDNPIDSIVAVIGVWCIVFSGFFTVGAF